MEWTRKTKSVIEGDTDTQDRWDKLSLQHVHSVSAEPAQKNPSGALFFFVCVCCSFMFFFLIPVEKL